jgi:hypothetical protein
VDHGKEHGTSGFFNDLEAGLVYALVHDVPAAVGKPVPLRTCLQPRAQEAGSVPRTGDVFLVPSVRVSSFVAGARGRP